MKRLFALIMVSILCIGSIPVTVVSDDSIVLPEEEVVGEEEELLIDTDLMIDAEMDADIIEEADTDTMDFEDDELFPVMDTLPDDDYNYDMTEADETLIIDDGFQSFEDDSQDEFLEVGEEEEELEEALVEEIEVEEAEEELAISSSGRIIASGNCNDSISWNLDEDGLLTISGTGEMPSMDPDRDNRWNGMFTEIYNVVIEEGITSVGDFAFDDFYRIKSIVLPESVERIGKNAFTSASNLSVINIPQHVSVIDDYAFSCCTKLYEINLPEGLQYLGEGAFERSSLQNIYIPGCVETIGKQAFANCRRLTTGIITEGKEKIIGEEAFNYCKNLSDLELGEGIKEIGSHAFYSCEKLADVTIPGSAESIGEYAFASSSVVHVTINEGVKSIGHNAFEQCYQLEEVHIPTSIETVGYLAFSSCFSLKSIAIPDGVKTIEIRTFEGCEALTYVELPESLEIIEDYAFKDCKQMDVDLYLPNIKTIGIEAFEDSKLSSVVLGNKLETIGEKAFYDNTLISLTIEGNVTVIGNSSFHACQNLENVSISGNVDLIGSGAFEYCSSLINFEVIGYVKQIGESAFGGCRTLLSADIQEGIDSIGTAAFSTCKMLTQIPNLTGTQSIGAGAFVECDSLSEISIPGTVETIGEEAFTKCDSLTKVSMSVGVKNIESSVFASCKNLTSITIPDTVETIGYRAFYDCDGLLTVHIPNGVNTIGAEAFIDCDALTEITIPGSVERINSKTFYSCDHLETATISSGVKSIGMNAFYYTDLETVFLPVSIVTLEDDCFTPYLGEIYYEGSLEEWQQIKGYTRIKFKTIHFQKTGIPVDISKLHIELIQDSYTYTGEIIIPDVIVTNSKGETLNRGTDYTITTKCFEIGEATATITGCGDYTGSTTITYQIVSEYDISGALVLVFPSFYYYTGEPIEANISSVLIKGEKLVQGTDYTVSYENNTEVGFGKAILEGKGTYTGKKTVRYEIRPEKISLQEINYDIAEGLISDADFTWNTLSYISGDNAGYEIRIAGSNDSIENADIEKYTAKEANGKVNIEYLSLNKKMKAQIRAYKEVDGEELKGPWSDEKEFIIDAKSGFTLLADLLHFPNLDNEFSENYYERWFGKGSNYSDECYRKDHGTKGQCYGMCNLISCIYEVNKPSLDSFGVSSVYSINPDSITSMYNMSAREIIGYGQAFQKIPSICYQKDLVANDYKRIIDTLLDFIDGSIQPIVLGIRTEKFGHAVIPLSIDKETSEEIIVDIYDCNNPGEIDKLHFQKNANGDIIGFSYDAGYAVYDANIYYSLPTDSFPEYFSLALNNNEKISVIPDYDENATLISTTNDMINISSNDGSTIVPIWYENDYNNTSNYFSYWVLSSGSEISFSNVNVGDEISIMSSENRLDLTMSSSAAITASISNTSGAHVVIDQTEKEPITIRYYDGEMGTYNGFSTRLNGTGDNHVELTFNDNEEITFTGMSDISMDYGQIVLNSTDGDQILSSETSTFSELRNDTNYSFNILVNGGINTDCGGKHLWSEYDPTDAAAIIKEASCMEEGSYWQTCSVCKEKQKGVIPKTGHSAEVDMGQAATCISSGLTEGSHCSVCGTVLSTQEMIPALGHNWGAWSVTTLATTTTEGVETRTCTRQGCGAKETRKTSKLPPAQTGTSTTGNTPAQTGASTTSNTTAQNETSTTSNIPPNSVTPTSAPTTVEKLPQPMTVKAKTPSVKASKLEKKKQTIKKSKAFTIKKAKGRVTFKKVSGSKKLTISKTGKITVKKGTKKGKYKIKVAVTAAGNEYYNAGTKTVTVRVKVK